MPKISVVTLLPDSYIKYVGSCAESLAKQTFKDFEWVIVRIKTDETSTPIPFELERELSVLVTGFDHDPGICTSRNAGVEAASGEYILMLDPDDRLHPEALERLVAEADANTLVTCGLREFGGRQRFGIPQGPFTYEAFKETNRIYYTTLYPKAIVEQIGGYDTALDFLGIEDYEFWIRAAKAGYKFKVVPELLLFYRVHENSHTARFSQFNQERFDYVRKKHADLN